jgi:hypothetical protein
MKRLEFPPSDRFYTTPNGHILRWDPRSQRWQLYQLWDAARQDYVDYEPAPQRPEATQLRLVPLPKEERDGNFGS